MILGSQEEPLISKALGTFYVKHLNTVPIKKQNLNRRIHKICDYIKHSIIFFDWL